MKKFWLIFIIISFLCVSIFSISFGREETDTKSDDTVFSQGLDGTVTTDLLKIRTGIGTENTHIGLLKKGDTLKVYGKVDNWYIIKTENNMVGAVFAEYIDVSHAKDQTIETSAPAETTSISSNTQLSQDEQIFFNLINNKRIENNLPEFEIDETVLNIARLKAQDLVQKKYFSHTSPTYGSIFEMLSKHNISYSKASENIARNINADSAVKSLMNSEPHKNNILSEEFNYTGIAVVNSIDWGKVFVQVFVAK